MDLDVHLAAIAAGDAEAFGSWLAGAEPAVRRPLRSFAHVVDTEAVLQEALLRVWQIAPKFQPDGRPNALVRFASRVARNLALDHARRARLRPMELDGLERAAHAEDSTVASPPDPLLRELIQRCFDKLPGKPAAALQGRLDGGRHDRDLAEALQMRLNTFLKNVGRAKTLLAECLRKNGVALEGP
ncbi:MAG: RNA polymerase sigma factor [Myxococcota bacterium]